MEEVIAGKDILFGKIIVADDDEPTLDNMEKILTNMGLASNSDFCVNGQEAIDRATEILEQFLNSSETKYRKPITAMLLDLQMPFKTGL